MEVTLINHMGSDLDVVNAARVSFAKESEWNVHEDFETSLKDKDAKLIRYLAEHNHWSPFAHCFASFRIKAPIFVARQLVKHQVGLAWNEVSRRYVDDTPEYFIPESVNKRPNANIKQGSGAKHPDSVFNVQLIKQHSDYCTRLYNELIDQDVAPEQARMVLPLNHMTEWIWSGSLMAWARVCKLRLDKHAQGETADVALQIADQIARLFPVSFENLVMEPWKEPDQ